MEWIEIEGNSQEEVETRAKEAMNVNDLTLLEIEELKVTRRFMGMGGVKYKIRARLIEKSEPEVVELALVQEEVVADAAPVEEKATVRADSPSEEDVVTMDSTYRPWVSEGEFGVVIPKKGRGFGSRLYSAEPAVAVVASAKPKEARPVNKPDEERYEEPVEEPIEPVIYEDIEGSPVSEEVRDQAVGFIVQTLQHMGFAEPVVKGFRLEDRLMVQISLESSGLIIGRKGETLESLQYLTDIIVNRGLEKRIRLILDADDYREKRKRKVFQVAKKAASDAVRTSKSISLSPMNPTERRYAHMCLAEDNKVETRSEGEGARRRVVIHPKGVKKAFSGNNRGHGKGEGNKGQGPRRRR